MMVGQDTKKSIMLRDQVFSVSRYKMHVSLVLPIEFYNLLIIKRKLHNTLYCIYFIYIK